VLNPDLRILADPFASMVEIANSDPQIALIAPIVLNSAGGVEDSVRANLTPLSLVRRHLRRDRSSDATGSFRWFAGMFLFLRASAFREIGGFDERFFLYCEDYDLCARLRLAGYGIVQDRRTTVIHSARRDSRRSARHLRWHVSSLLRVWRSAAFARVTCLDLFSSRKNNR
jgi:GT2 family glycosyltransferase